MAKTITLDAYLAALDAPTRTLMDALRRQVLAADPRLHEEIKWNAPSYGLDGQDRVTLGVERKGGLRLVLHRGAATQNVDGFRFDDPDGLARWPAPDRGVVLVKDEAALADIAVQLTALIQRWIKANTGAPLVP